MNQDRYLGMVALGSAIRGIVQFRNASDTPLEPTTTAYRVYGASASALATGTLAQKDTGVITGATNASPIVVTSNGHGLSLNTRVTVASVGGTTAANGDWQISAVTSNTFTLSGSTGNGAYTSGGTWSLTGLWEVNFTPTLGAGFAAGSNYLIQVTATVDSVVKSCLLGFTVV